MNCITACVHANGGSCGLYFRNSGTVLLHVYMQMEVAVVSTSDVQGLLLHVYMQMEVSVIATSEVQGMYYCMCTCKWKFRDCITACVHANGGGCGPYLRSSGTVLLHVYMQMEVVEVSTSEVQGLYYCICTCK